MQHMRARKQLLCLRGIEAPERRCAVVQGAKKNTTQRTAFDILTDYTFVRPLFAWTRVSDQHLPLAPFAVRTAQHSRAEQSEQAKKPSQPSDCTRNLSVLLRCTAPCVVICLNESRWVRCQPGARADEGLGSQRFLCHVHKETIILLIKRLP